MAAVAAFPGAVPAETGYTRDFNFGACGGVAAAGSNPYFSLRPRMRPSSPAPRTGRGSA
ncbi:MAG TPA: hypothetical protein VK387_09205 [Thermoleophilaceae bacterium]|nr:hypothetical protein [Thermoleophilaceae bacterium]